MSRAVACQHGRQLRHEPGDCDQGELISGAASKGEQIQRAFAARLERNVLAFLKQRRIGLAKRERALGEKHFDTSVMPMSQQSPSRLVEVRQ